MRKTRTGAFGGSMVVVGIVVADLVCCLLALALASGAHQIGPTVLLVLQVDCGMVLLGMV